MHQAHNGLEKSATIRQVILALECIEKGATDKDVSIAVKDEEMAQVCALFFEDSKWIEREAYGKVHLTKQGMKILGILKRTWPRADWQ